MKNYGETFDIQFDLILHKKKEKSGCISFVYVSYNEELEEKDFEGKDFEEKAGIFLCPDHRLVFETNVKNHSHSAIASYAITPDVEHHIQYKQFRQHDYKYNGELKRFVKIDNEIVLDRQINSTLVSDVTIDIHDFDPYGSISNFKMSK